MEDAAEYLLGQLEELRRNHSGRRVALIADGEVSSPVTGDGVGGRNAAFVLACVEKIAGKRIAVLSAGRMGLMGIVPRRGRWRMELRWRGRGRLGMDVAGFF